MKHILFIDPLEKLNPKKDTTCMLALTMKEMGKEVYLMFEEDFHYINRNDLTQTVYDFDADWENGGPYLKNFAKTKKVKLPVDKNITFHMRLDPPFDARYLRYLWMLKSIKETMGSKVINSPEGIMLHNEKLFALQKSDALVSFIGKGTDEFLEFTKKIKEAGFKDLILKPLDLYQGIGVEKIDLNADDSFLKTRFKNKVEEYKGPVIAQPFVKQVESGEVRAIYFKGKELGSIIKVPPKGQFLANIAQGATYDKVDLTDSQRSQCDQLSNELMKHGADWVAFDVLGDYVQEVNVTCPGLLVEVSKALGKNLARNIVEHLI